MANISITSRCNRNCTYCFTPASTYEDMSRTTFRRAVDNLVQSGYDQVRLLGGEPTLHLDLPWFIQYAQKRGLRILLFTNALWPDRILDWLQNNDIPNLAILANLNSPQCYRAEETAQMERLFKNLGHIIIPGFNIHTPHPDLRFLISLINDFNMVPMVRLGLAHRAHNKNNTFLHPKFYRQAGDTIYEFARQSGTHGIDVEFDCGFVPCMFPEAIFQMENVKSENVGVGCGSIPDILPNGTHIHCYPLADCGSLIPRRDMSLEMINDTLEHQLNPLRSITIYPECEWCTLMKNGECKGGCMGTAAIRLRKPDKLKQVHIEASKDLAHKARNPSPPGPRWLIPYIDQPLSFWQQLSDNFGTHIKAVYGPLPDDPIGTGRPVQSNHFLRDFLHSSIFSYSPLINPLLLDEEVESLFPAVITSLEKYAQKFVLKELTVASLELARLVKTHYKELSLTASVLMDIHSPQQLEWLTGLVDTLVPSSRIFRNLAALHQLKQGFPGKIRLIANEGCLPACPFRQQHFAEMNSGMASPKSLCDEMLREQPWLRLTGSWILPQHLFLYKDIIDEMKLAGRVTLRDPHRYRDVLSAYLHATPTTPDKIGAGPASVLSPIHISLDFYKKTLKCGWQCATCQVCKAYYQKAMKRKPINFMEGAI